MSPKGGVRSRTGVARRRQHACSGNRAGRFARQIRLTSTTPYNPAPISSKAAGLFAIPARGFRLRLNPHPGCPAALIYPAPATCLHRVLQETQLCCLHSVLLPDQELSCLHCLSLPCQHHLLSGTLPVPDILLQRQNVEACIQRRDQASLRRLHSHLHRLEPGCVLSQHTWQFRPAILLHRHNPMPGNQLRISSCRLHGVPLCLTSSLYRLELHAVEELKRYPRSR